MTMNKLIFRLLQALLDLNARLYGRGASHEVCRDLRGRYAEVAHA